MTRQSNRMSNVGMLLTLLLAVSLSLQAADFIKGTYSITMGGDKFSIKYDDNNKLTVARNGESVVEGTYKITEDVIEVTDETGPMACGGDAKIGKYKWKLEGKKLTFTKIEDGCEGRSGALTGQAWTQE